MVEAFKKKMSVLANADCVCSIPQFMIGIDYTPPKNRPTGRGTNGTAGVRSASRKLPVPYPEVIGKRKTVDVISLSS